MATNQKDPPSHNHSDSFLLVCAGDLVWFRVLSLHRLALAGSLSVGVARYGILVPQFSLPAPHRNSIGTRTGNRSGPRSLPLFAGAFIVIKFERHAYQAIPEDRVIDPPEIIRMSMPYTINDRIAKISMTHNIRETSSLFPSATLITVQLRNPQRIP